MVLWHELCLSKSGVNGDLNGKPWTFNQFGQYLKHYSATESESDSVGHNPLPPVLHCATFLDFACSAESPSFEDFPSNQINKSVSYLKSERNQIRNK